MIVRKAVAGSICAAGLGVAGIIGAGTASADWGIGGSVNGQTTQFGDVDVSSSAGNAAFAVNTPGFDKATASADGKGRGNLALSAWGGTSQVGNGDSNIAASAFNGHSRIQNGDHNLAVALGDDSSVRVVGNDSNVAGFSACGGTVTSAQAARISAPCLGG